MTLHAKRCQHMRVKYHNLAAHDLYAGSFPSQLSLLLRYLLPVYREYWQHQARVSPGRIGPCHELVDQLHVAQVDGRPLTEVTPSTSPASYSEADVQVGRCGRGPLLYE